LLEIEQQPKQLRLIKQFWHIIDKKQSSQIHLTCGSQSRSTKITTPSPSHANKNTPSLALFSSSSSFVLEGGTAFEGGEESPEAESLEAKNLTVWERK
jgi:hypothetical protein